MSSNGGFNFGDFMDDAGSSIQAGATSWLNSEIDNKLNPKKEAQPDSTLSQYQSELAAAYQRNKMIILGVAGIGIAIFVIKLLIRKGGKRGK